MARRDHQRDRVYAAEDLVLEEFRPLVLTLRQAQDFTNDVVSGEIFGEVSGGHDGVVVQETEKLWAWADKTSMFIAINPGWMQPMVLLHELGHVALIRAPGRYRIQDHGPEFVQLLDRLYRRYLSKEEYYGWRTAALLGRVQGIQEAMAPTN